MRYFYFLDFQFFRVYHFIHKYTIVLTKVADEMHFLEAHKIVHEFGGALAKSKCGFIPYSSIKYSKQAIYDAFVIFFGHMVLYGTREPKMVDQYMTILTFVPNLINDESYNDILQSNAVLDKAKESSIYRLFHKNEIENAEICQRMRCELALKCHQEYTNRARKFDYGAFIDKCVTMKKRWKSVLEVRGEDFNSFWNSYIEYVYSCTSQKHPYNESYALFLPFDALREQLNRIDELEDFEKEIYSEYRDYILNSK